ncbi:mas-related G-protein coupled receptor member A2-like [Oenanthe melanoleuca]|uniref:mas-related G-protein coupled receptor member A2-like n=1 Tax=Oenanthe melanoleuca TaxID=2939378 RepID=UPI0024C1079E|nr:mas-related G-protein coupled receptor member A2-like [Oenanthe melanoleuca]
MGELEIASLAKSQFHFLRVTCFGDFWFGFFFFFCYKSLSCCCCCWACVEWWGTGLCSGCLASTAAAPITICVLTLAMADFTFLLSTTITLGVFLSLRASATSWAHDRAVTAGLDVTILLAFPAGIYSLTAFSAVTALFVLQCPAGPATTPSSFPVLLCALLWLLSFLLTVTLWFHPSVLMAVVLSYLFSVLTLTCSGLILLPRLLCWSWKQPPWKFCALLLLPVVSLPFFTAHFGYWLLLMEFDFSVFPLNTSLMLAFANSSAHPLIYFLAGSCAEEFTLSGSVAFQRALRMCQSQEIGTALWNHHQVESS